MHCSIVLLPDIAATHALVKVISSLMVTAAALNSLYLLLQPSQLPLPSPALAKWKIAPAKTPSYARARICVSYAGLCDALALLVTMGSRMLSSASAVGRAIGSTCKHALIASCICMT